MSKKKKRSPKKQQKQNMAKKEKGIVSKKKQMNLPVTHHVQDIGEYYEDNSSLRLDWLLNLSSFFFIGAGIIVIYGGWFIARTYLPPLNGVLIAKHNDIIINGLLYGSLLFETGIFFKLYSLIYTIGLKQKAEGVQPPEGEWFLKLAIVLLAAASCIILTTGFVKQHVLLYGHTPNALFIKTVATYLKRCILSGSFFLLLAIFTQVYLLFLKIVRRM